MNSPSYLLSLALLYICALFAVAWYVDRGGEAGAEQRSPRWRSLVYVFSLCVYCSSWTFYGAVGSATASPWSHAPIYLGPILVFLLCWPLLRRLTQLGTRHRVTSIADYLGARFGKRQSLSMLVTAVAAAAVLPYIALQFRALTGAWAIIANESSASAISSADSALTVAIVLALFTILFGTRRLDARERHQGMVSAIALESVVKLVAFLCVALLALSYLLKVDTATPVDWGLQSPMRTALTADFFTRTLISACAIFCLPRQFHVMVVEAPGVKGASPSRWLLPLYLLLFMLLVVPISLAGSHLFAQRPTAGITPDTYVQWVPAILDQPAVAVIAFVGGISAATGMVVVATVSLAIMLTNEVAVPALIRGQSQNGTALLSMGNRLRRIRQLTIVAVLLAAWLVSQQLKDIAWLTEIGFMSFLAAAQLAPGLLAGLYWRRAHGLAVTIGLVLGLLLWFVCLVLPAVMPDSHWLLTEGAFGVTALRPSALLGWQGPGPLTYAALWSLGTNVAMLIGLSLILRTSASDLRQVSTFLDASEHTSEDHDTTLSPVRAAQLRALLPPFIGEARLAQLWRSMEARYEQRLLPADRIPLFALREVESTLAGVIGATSASRVVRELTETRQLEFAELAALVTDADRQRSLNRDLLEATIESLQQGVSVVDAELRLLAWNTRYEEMFAYPERLLYVGIPIERLYRYNAERGVMSVNARDIDSEVEKRLAWLRQGHPHHLERRLPDGRVIDIHGVPLPGEGFVTSYIDVTEYREMLTQLEESRLELESRIASGSESLADTNAQLRRENRLRAEAESMLREANLSKTRFMSATSHDLLQPINAARLFVAALRTDLDADGQAAETVNKIDQALGRAENLIEELREVARLDSGHQRPKLAPFALQTVLQELYAEYAPLAERRGLHLRLRTCSLWLHSDRRLVYRILQNLLGNAINYTREGSILIGVRRRPEAVEIQVLDQGPGIAEADRLRVFTEFERLGHTASGSDDGLGLGLAIVSRYAKLLGLPLRLDSEPGKGSLFSIGVPVTTPAYESAASPTDSAMSDSRLGGVSVLCIDNDRHVREALASMLQAQGCTVSTVADRHALVEKLPQGNPQVIVADYHLDDGDNGIAAVQWSLDQAGLSLPVIVVSADNGHTVRELAKSAGFRYLPKPVNPARLAALIRALTTEQPVPAAPSLATT